MRPSEKEVEAVLQKALELMNRVNEVSAKLPPEKQWKMRRAAASTAVNVAEGLARLKGKKD